jgi:phosphoribosylamine--glycine ligase
MGSISPVPWLTERMLDETIQKIVEPTFAALAKENLSYEGVLYFGLIWTERGPFVLEYNVRFGDPETQVLVPRFDFDLVELYLALSERRLKDFEDKACVQERGLCRLGFGRVPGALREGLFH